MTRQTKPKKLKLTPQLINDQDALYDKLKKITFEDGMYTEIYESFRPTAIDTCIIDMANFLAEYKKNKGKVSDNKDFFKFLYLFIVQHFSTLVPELPSDFPTRLSLMNKLANNKYVLGLEGKFDDKEIKKVYEIIFKKITAMQDMVQTNKQVRQQLLDKIDTMDLEYKDVIKQIMIGEGNGDDNVQ